MSRRLIAGAALLQLVERSIGRREIDALVMVQLLHEFDAGLGRHGGDDVGLGDAVHYFSFCLYLR